MAADQPAQLNGQVRVRTDVITMLPLGDLTPAAVNDQVYKPIDPADPATVALADLVRAQGLIDPIVITLDNVILSGHRRRVACQLAGLEIVPIRIHPVRSTDPEFVPLLVSFNAQRVKTVAEAVREEVIRTS